MDVSAESYFQNPFCKQCLPERLQQAANEDPVVGWREEGDYVVPVRKSELRVVPDNSTKKLPS